MRSTQHSIAPRRHLLRLACLCFAGLAAACGSEAPEDNEEDATRGRGEVGETRDIGRSVPGDTGSSDGSNDPSDDDATVDAGGADDAGSPDVEDAGSLDAEDAGSPDAEAPDGGADVSDPDTGGSDTVAPPVDADPGEAVCGDGVVEGVEECDDGNRLGGDGCAADCTRELEDLCQPCTLNDDCGGPADFCVDGYCALACGAGCPADYTCTAVPFGLETVEQCLPDEACAGAAELCSNGRDDDGDSAVDCDDSDCAADPACATVGAELCSNGRDDDGDSAVDCDDSDCDADPACAGPVGSACDNPQPAVVGEQRGTLAAGVGSLSSPLCGGSGAEQAWSFVAPESRTYCVDTRGSSFDSVLYARTSCALPSSEETCNDDAGATVASEIQFRAIAGETLYLVVDAYSVGDGGAYVLSIGDEPCGTTGGSDPEICDDGIDNDGDFYTDCRDSDCDGNPACVESLCDDGEDNDDDFYTDCFDSDCDDDPACRPGGTVCEDARAAMVGTTLGDVGGGSSRMRGSCGGGGPEQAWSFTAASAGSYCFDTRGTAFDTVLYARRSCDDAGTQIACNDDTGGSTSEIELELGLGESITLFVDAYSASSAVTGYGLNIFASSCDDAYPEICDDGVDNDGDFYTDCRDDDCEGSPPCTESICDDGEDNDGDFYTDCRDDDCEGSPPCTESICDDGEDNDGDFDTDCSDSDCDESPACAPRGCDDPIAFAGFGTYTGDNTNAANAESSSCVPLAGREQVIAWTPSASGTVCVDTRGSSFDTVLNARTSCGSSGSELACDDDIPGSNASEIEFEVSAGEPVFVMVEAYSSFSYGSYELNFAEGACE